MKQLKSRQILLLQKFQKLVKDSIREESCKENVENPRPCDRFKLREYANVEDVANERGAVKDNYGNCAQELRDLFTSFYATYNFLFVALCPRLHLGSVFHRMGPDMGQAPRHREPAPPSASQPRPSPLPSPVEAIANAPSRRLSSRDHRSTTSHHRRSPALRRLPHAQAAR